MKRLLLCLGLLGSACSTTNVPPPDREQIDALEDKAEKLSAGDVIEIRSSASPNLAGVYRVGRTVRITSL